MTSLFRIGMISLYASALAAGSAGGPSQKATSSPVEVRRCSIAARKSLGNSAIVLKCGHLTGRPKLETIAAVPLNGVKQRSGSVAVRHLVILKQTSRRWVTELRVNEQIKNPAGYIGKFLSPPGSSKGYYTSFDDHRSDGSAGFVVYLAEIDEQGEAEWPLQISWNPIAERFQLYAGDEDPVGFRTEVQRPIRPKTRGCTSCKQNSEKPTTLGDNKR